MTNDLRSRLLNEDHSYHEAACHEAWTKIEALTAERDIAVADLAALKQAIAAKGGSEHAPTQDAYDAACRALISWRNRADKAEADNARLREALSGLLADIQDYQRINSFGGENNHWQVIARAALKGETP